MPNFHTPTTTAASASRMFIPPQTDSLGRAAAWAGDSVPCSTEATAMSVAACAAGKMNRQVLAGTSATSAALIWKKRCRRSPPRGPIHTPVTASSHTPGRVGRWR